MSPTHVKRQGTARAAAPKAAARGASRAKTTDDTNTDTKGQTVTAPAKTAEVSPSLDVQTPALDEQTPAEAPEAAPEAPASTEAAPEAPAVPRASLLQALATGQKVEAVTAAPAVAAAAHGVTSTGRREVWSTGEDAVEALVIADLYKATVDGVPHFGYRGTIVTLPKANAAHGLRFGALTEEF